VSAIILAYPEALGQTDRNGLLPNEINHGQNTTELIQESLVIWERSRQEAILRLQSNSGNGSMAERTPSELRDKVVYFESQTVELRRRNLQLSKSVAKLTADKKESEQELNRLIDNELSFMNVIEDSNSDLKRKVLRQGMLLRDLGFDASGNNFDYNFSEDIQMSAMRLNSERPKVLVQYLMTKINELLEENENLVEESNHFRENVNGLQDLFAQLSRNGKTSNNIDKVASVSSEESGESFWNEHSLELNDPIHPMQPVDGKQSKSESASSHSLQQSPERSQHSQTSSLSSVTFQDVSISESDSERTASLHSANTPPPPPTSPPPDTPSNINEKESQLQTANMIKTERLLDYEPPRTLIKSESLHLPTANGGNPELTLSKVPPTSLPTSLVSSVPDAVFSVENTKFIANSSRYSELFGIGETSSVTEHIAGQPEPISDPVINDDSSDPPPPPPPPIDIWDLAASNCSEEGVEVSEVQDSEISISLHDSFFLNEDTNNLGTSVNLSSTSNSFNHSADTQLASNQNTQPRMTVRRPNHVNSVRQKLNNSISDSIIRRSGSVQKKQKSKLGSKQSVNPIQRDFNNSMQIDYNPALADPMAGRKISVPTNDVVEPAASIKEERRSSRAATADRRRSSATNTVISEITALSFDAGQPPSQSGASRVLPLGVDSIHEQFGSDNLEAIFKEAARRDSTGGNLNSMFEGAPIKKSMKKIERSSIVRGNNVHAMFTELEKATASRRDSAQNRDNLSELFTKSAKRESLQTSERKPTIRSNNGHEMFRELGKTMAARKKGTQKSDDLNKILIEAAKRESLQKSDRNITIKSNNSRTMFDEIDDLRTGLAVAARRESTHKYGDIRDYDL
jgi:hypothetical protein